jgi:nitrilase
VVVGDDATQRLAAAAAEGDLWVAIGITERATESATLYDSLLYLTPDGRVAGCHRKLTPTGVERIVWGQGDGSTLHALDTDIGRVGGLICWENLMPLARAAMYGQGIDIHLAPTWDNDDAWLSTLRHIAREGGVYVLGTNSCIHGSDVPRTINALAELYGGDDDWLSRGNAAIVAPAGRLGDRRPARGRNRHPVRIHRAGRGAGGSVTFRRRRPLRTPRRAPARGR